MACSRRYKQGFALPTIVIASLVLFMVLVAAVGSASSIRAALDTQFYDFVGRDVLETAASRAKDCVLNSNLILNTDVKPNTNCDGSVNSLASLYIQNGNGYRTSYTIRMVSSTAQKKEIKITSLVEKIRQSSAVVYQSYTKNATQLVMYTPDEAGDRASKRYWFFGNNVKFDFGTSGTAQPIVSAGNLIAGEGTTVVTNQSGDLQFTSDGLTIWDKTGAIMQNGSGLSGASSATQAVVSFPMNKNRTKYGVVSNTAMGETGYGPGELYLSVVDMTLNGGNGAVTIKNQKLGIANDYSSEGLGAMPNNDGSGYWVYSFSSTAPTITGFLIKLDGSVTGPVTTSLAGANAPTVCTTWASGLTGYGSFNFSKDFSTMLLLIGATGCGAGQNGTLYLIKPDASTGALTVSAKWVSTSGLSGNGYSADFSPSGKYAYVTQLYQGALTRYDISSGNSTTIKSSEWQIGSNTTLTDATSIHHAGGQVRQGADGRMYMPDRAYSYSSFTPCKMSYINQPDNPTTSTLAIGLSLDAITLPVGACSIWGLPQTATVYVPRVVTY